LAAPLTGNDRFRDETLRRFSRVPAVLPLRWCSPGPGLFAGSRRLQNLEYSHLSLTVKAGLCAYATSEGLWRLPVTAQDVDPRFPKLLFTYEDKRLQSHPGVDQLSLA
jgi:hypothetical protein